MGKENQALKEFHHLHTLSRETQLLSGIGQILDWDRETYMPPAGATMRAEQLELLAGLTHKQKTSKAFRQALEKLIHLDSGKLYAHTHTLNPRQIAALHCWRHDYLKAVKLPEKFVKTFAKTSSQAITVWTTAKSENAFYKFAPYLDKLVTLSREKAELIGYEAHPYDVLLDDYEAGITTKEVNALFKKLRPAVTGLLDKIMRRKGIDDSFLHNVVSEEKQMHFNKELLRAIGFDFEKGRLDISSHPFSSSSSPIDNRITTRIDTRNFFSAISSTLHEAGHAFYEMGLSIENYGSPLGEPISLGAHESQSRWWENLIGRSKPFWHHFLPLVQKKFKGPLVDVSLDTFYKAINKVTPSLIRVEADEVTYSLHIILRFEIECALIEGALNIRDVPAAWNEKMQMYLGLTPPDDRQGCLQDIHWSMGGFGYFPTYTLGNLYASHLFLAFEKTFLDWEKQIAKGDCAFMLQWLHEHFHAYGRQYTSVELLKKITGKKFSETAYLDYLNKKYNH